MLKKTLTTIGYLLIMAMAGFAILHYLINPRLNNQPSNSETLNKQATQALFALQLPDSEGKLQALKQWQGKTIVLNFWATWCPPCREEMPELSALNLEYQQRNVVVVGIAIDELEAVKSFAHDPKPNAIKVSYPLLAAEAEGAALAAGLGNDKGVLPYTVIIKPDGTVAKTYLGRVTKPLLKETLVKLL